MNNIRKKLTEIIFIKVYFQSVDFYIPKRSQFKFLAKLKKTIRISTIFRHWKHKAHAQTNYIFKSES